MSDCSRVITWLKEHGIEYDTRTCPPEADRHKIGGPYIYWVQTGDFVWEFLPTGCLERFTTTPHSRWPDPTAPVVPIHRTKFKIPNS